MDSTNSPRISFIVPIYRPNPSVFEKCIKSLLAQALTGWEVIFILDGPCSEARAIIARLMRGRGNFNLVEIEHGGACAARNAGEKHASGDILCFWDCDCWIEPGASKMWVEQFDKRPEVGFIYSGYKFSDDRNCIESEAWDYEALKTRNFISTCFPVRRKLYPGWTEGLKSLQDWDFWLSVVEKAVTVGYDDKSVGFFIPGYAFTTEYPDASSISGSGCLPENWLERMDAVRDRHHIKARSVCVSSLEYQSEAKTLANLIDADFLRIPNDKPHRYETIVQLGFSFRHGLVDIHAGIFKEKLRNILFWTTDNIDEIYNRSSLTAIRTYSSLLNICCRQFVEDYEAKKKMEEAGFRVEILRLPMVRRGDPSPLPGKPKWVVDIDGKYGAVLEAVNASLPDIPLEPVSKNSLGEYTGLIHLFQDRTTSNTVKRAIMSGRHVISNIKSPFCGYIEDSVSDEKLFAALVRKVRKLSKEPVKKDAMEYYDKELSPARLLEVLA